MCLRLVELVVEGDGGGSLDVRAMEIAGEERGEAKEEREDWRAEKEGQQEQLRWHGECSGSEAQTAVVMTAVRPAVVERKPTLDAGGGMRGIEFRRLRCNSRRGVEEGRSSSRRDRGARLTRTGGRFVGRGGNRKARADQGAGLKWKR